MMIAKPDPIQDQRIIGLDVDRDPHPRIRMNERTRPTSLQAGKAPTNGTKRSRRDLAWEGGGDKGMIQPTGELNHRLERSAMCAR
jgi:hypothetical protein